MSYTTTPNFGLYKPVVNGDDDQWGAHLNSNADIIDNVLYNQFLPLAGGTIGPLTVNGAFTVGIVDNSAVNFNFGGGGVVHISSTAWWPGITFEVNNTSYGQYLRTNRNGKNRWIMEIGNADPETGSNSGTNFALMNIADDGATQLGTPLSISRATGVVTLGGSLLANAAYPAPGITSTSDVHANRNLFVGEGNAASALNYIVISVNGSGDAQATMIKQKNRSASITSMSQAGGLQSTRWLMVLGDNTTETGTGNAGCDFAIRNYDDTGNTQLGTPLAINRATGNVTLGSALTLTAGPLVLPSTGTPAAVTLRFEAAYPNCGFYGTHTSISCAFNGSLAWAIGPTAMLFMGAIVNLPGLGTTATYANDAAAATGGVAVGQLYRNGSVVQIRVV